MAYEELTELLTGRALGISPERLDMQGWVAAFRAYRDAIPSERREMEVSLATAISVSSDWGFIADAVHLARSHQMGSPPIRTAIVYAELTAKLAAPVESRDVIATEAERYLRDVPRPEIGRQLGAVDAQEGINAAETEPPVSVGPGNIPLWDTGESSLDLDPPQSPQLVSAAA